jgi:hypothetical protein
VREPHGAQRAHATAWVVSANALATTAHVGAEVEKARQRGAVVVARSRLGADFEIAGVTVHPGYAQFPQLVSEHSPAVPGAQGAQTFVPNVRVCDAALLRVHDGSNLGPALPIASAATLAALGAGDRIGAAGHPIGGRSAGGAPEWLAAKPEPQTHMGSITSVTDFLLLHSDADRSIIQHSFPISPGSSGPPILNPRGEVVAVHSHGETVEVRTEGAAHPRPVSTGVGIGYAQNAEMIRELLLPDLEDTQLQRRQKWASTLQRFLSYREQTERMREDYRLSRIQTWRDQLGVHALEDVAQVTVTSLQWRGIGETTDTPRQESVTLRPGSYVVLFLPDEHGNYLAAVDEIESGVTLAQATGRYPELRLDAEQERKIEVRLEGEKAARAIVHFLRGTMTPIGQSQPSNREGESGEKTHRAPE